MRGNKQTINNVDGFQFLSQNPKGGNIATVTSKTENGVDFINQIFIKQDQNSTTLSLKDTIFQVRAKPSQTVNFIFQTFEEAKRFKEEQDAKQREQEFVSWKGELESLDKSIDNLSPDLCYFDDWLTSKAGNKNYVTLRNVYDNFHENNNIHDLIKLKLQLGQIRITNDKIVLLTKKEN